MGKRATIRTRYNSTLKDLNEEGTKDQRKYDKEMADKCLNCTKTKCKSGYCKEFYK